MGETIKPKRKDQRSMTKDLEAKFDQHWSSRDMERSFNSDTAEEQGRGNARQDFEAGVKAGRNRVMEDANLMAFAEATLWKFREIVEKGESTENALYDSLMDVLKRLDTRTKDLA